MISNFAVSIGYWGGLDRFGILNLKETISYCIQKNYCCAKFDDNPELYRKKQLHRLKKGEHFLFGNFFIV